MMHNTLEQNITAHEAAARYYDMKHAEIYNGFEQNRLYENIRRLIASSDKLANELNVLDYGSGTGNLAIKFLLLGCNVTAADISQESLQNLQSKAERFGCESRLKTHVFNGESLSLPDEAFDIVATYSVLHHIPDYLQGVAEMMRVTKKRGWLYLEHEFSDDHWNPSEILQEYYALGKKSSLQSAKDMLKTGELFSLDFVKSFFIKRLFNARYQREGDIHVWPDDHIDWKHITTLAEEKKFDVKVNSSFLMYNPQISFDTYMHYSRLCSDMTYMILEKK